MNKWFQHPFVKGLLAVFFMAISAQLSVEVPESLSRVPITGQSLAVLVVAALLGSKRGALAVLLYLLLGGFGLPVFSNGESGWESFSGNSGGYLIGFLAAAWVVGKLNEKQPKTWLFYFLQMLIGTAIILLLGVTRLATLIGADSALQYGLYPFIPGALIKIVIGVLIVEVIQLRFFHTKN